MVGKEWMCLQLMEAVMGGDKATQERLQARADAAEAERKAMLEESNNQNEVYLTSDSYFILTCLFYHNNFYAS